jgi:hypothetical protein
MFISLSVLVCFLQLTDSWLFTNPVAQLMIIANTQPTPHKGTHNKSIHQPGGNLAKGGNRKFRTCTQQSHLHTPTAALSAFPLVFTAFASESQQRSLSAFVDA